MSHRSTHADYTRLTRIGEFEDQSGDSTEIVIPEDLSALSDEDLDTLHDRAVEAFNAVYGDGSGLTEDDLASLGSLTEGIEALSAEQAMRGEAAQQRADAAAALAARVNPAEALAKGKDDEDDNPDDEDDEDNLSSETDADEADEAEAGAEAGEAGEEAPEGDASLTAASPRKAIRVNLSSRARQTPARASSGRASAPETMRDIVMAAPDVPGFSNGQGMDWTDIGRAVDRRLTAFNAGQYEAANRAGRHMRQQFGVAVIRKPFEADLVVQSNDPGHVDEVIHRAMDESRLPGGSLVAAGGWCAPSEVIYDLCELESRDGLFSLPEIGIARGGIQFTAGPDFSTIFNNTGFSYTEAEDIAGDYDGAGGGSKPCYTVPCPTFDEERLNLDGVCISAGLLQQRGYPEVIARTTRGALVAHDHRQAANQINAIVAGSTAVAMPADQVGALAPILTSIELQVEHYRYIHRMSRSTSLEAVFPFWVRAAIRADLSRRLGVDLISVPDARIDQWFRERGVAPQFVYNWQDLTGAASDATALPTEVQFLLYTAGTWVKGGSDVITLDTIYDSVNLGTNDYTALFTEEGWLVAKMCHDSRVVTVPICADGATHAGVDIDCDGSAVVVTP